MESPLQHGDAKYAERSPGKDVCGVVIAQVNAPAAYDGDPNERQIPQSCLGKKNHCRQAEKRGGMIARERIPVIKRVRVESFRRKEITPRSCSGRR
jgi:hypothetical protein